MPRKVKTQSKSSSTSNDQVKKLHSEIQKLKKELQRTEKQFKATEQAWKNKAMSILHDAQKRIVAIELKAFKAGLAEGKKFSSLKDRAMRSAAKKAEQEHAKTVKAIQAKRAADVAKKADALKQQAAKRSEAKAKAIAAKAKAKEAKLKAKANVRRASTTNNQSQRRNPSRPVQSQGQPIIKLAVGSPINMPSKPQNPIVSSDQQGGGMGTPEDKDD